MSETPVTPPAEPVAEAPAEVPAPVAAPAPEPAPEPAPAAAPETAGKDELAKLIEDARGHLSGGIPQAAVEAVIRAVEILAGL